MGAVLPARAPQAESQLFTASLPALSWHSWSKTNTVLFEQLESDINSNGKNKIYLLIKNLSSYRWKRFLQVSWRKPRITSKMVPVTRCSCNALEYFLVVKWILYLINWIFEINCSKRTINMKKWKRTFFWGKWCFRPPVMLLNERA